MTGAIVETLAVRPVMMLAGSRATLFGVIFVLSIGVASVFSAHLVADDNDWLTHRISGADMVLVTAITTALESKKLDGPDRLALVSETQQTLKKGFALNDSLIVHQYTAIPALTFWMPANSYRNLQIDKDGNRRSWDSRLGGVLYPRK